MTNPSEDLLVTTEGVDEGSAASTVEGESAIEDTERAVDDAPTSGVDGEAQPAPPVDMETDESRAAREATGTGQQLAAGEG